MNKQEILRTEPDALESSQTKPSGIMKQERQSIIINRRQGLQRNSFEDQFHQGTEMYSQGAHTSRSITKAISSHNMKSSFVQQNSSKTVSSYLSSQKSFKSHRLNNFLGVEASSQIASFNATPELSEGRSNSNHQQQYSVLSCKRHKSNLNTDQINFTAAKTTTDSNSMEQGAEELASASKTSLSNYDRKRNTNHRCEMSSLNRSITQSSMSFLTTVKNQIRDSSVSSYSYQGRLMKVAITQPSSPSNSNKRVVLPRDQVTFVPDKGASQFGCKKRLGLHRTRVSSTVRSSLTNLVGLRQETNQPGQQDLQIPRIVKANREIETPRDQSASAITSRSLRSSSIESTNSQRLVRCKELVVLQKNKRRVPKNLLLDCCTSHSDNKQILQN